MKKTLLYLLAGLSILTVACDDFLDKKPTKSSAQKVETLNDLEAILKEPETHHIIRGSMVNFFCTDNTGFSLEMFQEYKSRFDDDILQQYTWDTKNTALKDYFWNACYAAIWNANLIINNIDRMEGDETRKKNIKAEAYALRAYKYFMLAHTYCLHFTEATAQEPGIPLRRGTDFEENQKRATLAETYARIDADLTEALKITTPFSGQRWRASRASVNAFAARYYLYRGNYTEAEKYANTALEEYDELIDYSTLGTYLYRTYQIPTTNGGTRNMEVYYPTTFLSTQKEKIEWAEQYQTESESESYYIVLPSAELLELYRQYPDDLRYKLFVVEGYMNYFGISEQAGYGYTCFGYGYVHTGPSVAEMFLIRAECKARQNDIDGCMADIETLRRTRFKREDYVALPQPADVKAAVQTVLDERRREAPFALRWMDLRRLTTDDLMDPVTVKRIFYPVVNGEADTGAQPIEYILTPDSRRYARPIIDEVINLSGGQTAQNLY